MGFKGTGNERCCMVACGLEYGPVAGCFENGNERSGCRKSMSFLNRPVREIW
jgi:hypothetical protein